MTTTQRPKSYIEKKRKQGERTVIEDYLDDNRYEAEVASICQEKNFSLAEKVIKLTQMSLKLEDACKLVKRCEVKRRILAGEDMEYYKHDAESLGCSVEVCLGGDVLNDISDELEPYRTYHMCFSIHASFEEFYSSFTLVRLRRVLEFDPSSLSPDHFF